MKRICKTIENLYSVFFLLEILYIAINRCHKKTETKDLTNYDSYR